MPTQGLIDRGWRRACCAGTGGADGGFCVAALERFGRLLRVVRDTGRFAADTLRFTADTLRFFADTLRFIGETLRFGALFFRTRHLVDQTWGHRQLRQIVCPGACQELVS
jgi:hypothetical protein